MSWADASSRARVLCAGIAVQDQVFALGTFPTPGFKARARKLVCVPGGCAANAAIACARLGGHASLIAPLGGPAGVDFVGDAILAGLMRENVDCSRVIRFDGALSPLSAIVVDAAGERTILNYRDETLSNARVAGPAAALEGVSALLVDNRFPELVIALCQAARERGLAIVLDADQPTRLTQDFLRLSTHIVFPADGLRATARRDDLVSALREVANDSKAFLAVTDGANGVTWLDSGELHHLPALVVEAADTLAAGDVFHGAFALALAEGKDAARALRFANVAAGLKCKRFGGIAGAPRREEVERELGSVA